jgi:hypothetical protein
MIFGTINKRKLQAVIQNGILTVCADGKVKRLIGFNEADSRTQANIHVSTAVSFWPDLEAAVIPLASPVVSQNAVRTWMEEWSK